MQEIELGIVLVERLRQEAGRRRWRTRSGRSVAREIRGTLGRALVRAGGRLGGELA